MKKLTYFLIVALFVSVMAFAPTRTKPEFVLIGGGNMLYSAPGLKTELIKRYPDALVVDCYYLGMSVNDIAQGSSIYNDCVAGAKVTGYSIKALFIFQGENDAVTMDAALAWRDKFNDIVKSFLHDTKSSGNTPVIYAQLGTPPAMMRDEWEVIQKAQADNLKGHPHYKMIQTSYLPSIENNIFFQPSAYPLIVQRYIKKFSTIDK